MSKLIIALYVVATTAALILLKLGGSSGAPISIAGSKLAFNINPAVVFGGLLYVTSFVLYTYLIAKFDLGYIIPLTTAIVYAMIFVASYLVFHEVFTVAKIAGITFILIGVILISSHK